MSRIMFFLQEEFTFASGKQLEEPANPDHLNPVRNQVAATTS